MQGKICNKHKAKSDFDVSELQAIQLNKTTLMAKLVSYSGSVGVVSFLSTFSSDQLKGFLKKKALPTSGSKEQMVCLRVCVCVVSLFLPFLLFSKSQPALRNRPSLLRT